MTPSSNGRNLGYSESVLRPVSVASAMNNAGQIVGKYGNFAVLCEDGRIIKLGTPLGRPAAVPSRSTTTGGRWLVRDER